MGATLPTTAGGVREKIRNFAATLPYARVISSLGGTAGQSPTTVNTSGNHGLTTGQSVTISGVVGGSFTPSINGTYTATVVDGDTFTIPIIRNNSTGLNLSGSSVLPPAPEVLRDRVRAVVHLIVTSPQFTVQK